MQPWKTSGANWQCDLGSLTKVLLPTVKVWLSVNEKKQRQLLSRRIDDPLRYWKYSPNDPKSLDAFDSITQKKNAMFELNYDWNVVDMESRDHGRNRVIDNIISQL